MSPDSCLACHKPFRENRELAAAPRGSRFAFEAASSRVWRVCHHCGHWNLMGPESAQAALPELDARFRASTAIGAPAIALARPSDSLEILRLGDRADLAAQALALGNRYRKLQAAVVPAAIMLLTLLVLLVGVFAAGWGPDLPFFSQLAAWMGGLLSAQSLRRWRLGLGPKTVRLWVGAVLLGAGTVTAALLSPLGALQGAGRALAGALAFGFFNEWATRKLTRHRLPSGRRVTVIVPDLLALRIRWSVDPATITVMPPDGDPLDATDSRYILTHLVEWVAGLPDPVLEQARTLAASTPHLGDLLRLLPGDGNGGEARLDDLPHVYWAALDFALSRERDAPDQIETVEEARRVATIAEELDGQS